MRVLIVDDEAPGLRALRNLLEREPGVEVVGECLDGRSAVEAVRSLRPDLLLLDIQMPRLDGFGVLAELSGEPLPLVVFVTAYDHYSLRAFQVHAVDYLLKPCGADALRGALARAQALLAARKEEAPERLQDFLEDVERGRERCHRFVVREGSRLTFVPVSDVEAIEATGNYMHLHVGRATHMIRETLGNLEARLPESFLRTHRSWILNIDKVKELRPVGKGAYVAVAEGGAEVPVSRQCRDRIDGLLRGTII
jgi:two-component system LytT family response regulator